MAGGSDRPTLTEYLGMMQIGSLVQKKRFGGYQVSLMQFLAVGLWLFVKGAIFGRARCDRLEIVAKMLVGLESLANTFAQLGLPAVLRRGAASREDWVFEYLRKVASDGMAYYRNCCRKEPESFLDLWLTSFAPPDVDFRDLQKKRKLAKRKIRLGVAWQRAEGWLLVGISFGATFPELTERMWKREYGKLEEGGAAGSRRGGLLRYGILS